MTALLPVLGRLVACMTISLLVSACGAPQAPRPARVYVVGFLAPGTETSAARLLDSFRQGMRDLGYEEGQQLRIEARYGGSGDEQLTMHAVDLVRLNVDV